MLFCYRITILNFQRPEKALWWPEGGGVREPRQENNVHWLFYMMCQKCLFLCMNTYWGAVILLWCHQVKLFYLRMNVDQMLVQLWKSRQEQHFAIPTSGLWVANLCQAYLWEPRYHYMNEHNIWRSDARGYIIVMTKTANTVRYTDYWL